MKLSVEHALTMSERLGEIGLERRLIDALSNIPYVNRLGHCYLRADGKIAYLIIHHEQRLFTGWELRGFEDEVDEATTNGINMYPERSEKYPDPAVMGASLMEWMLASGGI